MVGLEHPSPPTATVLGFFLKVALEQSLVDILLMDLSFFMDLFFHNDLAHLGKLGSHMTLRIEHLNSFLICSQSF